MLLVVIAALAVFANLLPLEMQKRIVNEAISLRKFDLLVVYCGIYLAAVVSATALKYAISVLQNVIGQRTVYAMRDEVYRHILTLPLSFYRKTQPGLVVSVLTKELATAGDFVGMAVAIPATNLMMLCAFSGYLFWLNPVLAALSLSIYPAILLIVPLLQKRVDRYNRMRVDATRRMSSKAGEAISGIHEIHANSAYAIEADKFSPLIKNLRRIRIIWNLYRHGVKRVNSLFTNFSRFLVFAVGGYLALHGRLELGALVAFLSAQDKLYDPWKELINFYQAYQTARVTYDQTMDYFDVATDHALLPSDREPLQLSGDIEVKNLDFVTEDGIQLLSDITFDLKHGEQMALVGFSGSGKSTLAKCIGQLYPYSGGEILIDRKEVSRLTKADMAHTIGFVSQEPFIFEGSVEENLLYSFLARGHGLHGEGIARAPSLDDKILALQQTGLFTDVLRFGLDAMLVEDRHEAMVDQILQVRQALHKEYGDKLADIVEFYHPERYLYCSSVAENLMFGPSLQASVTAELPEKDEFIRFLKKAELLEPLLQLGTQLIEALIKLYDNRSSEKEASQILEFIPPDAVREYKAILYHMKKRQGRHINRKKRRKILQAALQFVPKKHIFIQPWPQLTERIIQARALFKKTMCALRPDDIRFCAPSDYLYGQSILTNLLYGKLKDDSAAAQEKLNTVVMRLLIGKEFLEEIVAMGMQYQVGSKGANLSGGQQQKLAIARTFIKNPSILIMDEATSGLDNESQTRIQQLLEDRWRGRSTLLAVVHRLDIIKNYDKIAVMKEGKIVELGNYQELMDRQGILEELVHGKGR